MGKIAELFIAYKDEFAKSSLKNNELIDFSIPFTYSDLRNILNGTIYLKSSNQKISIKDSLIKLDDAIKNNNKLRIWSSHVDPDYYLFLLFICYYVKDKVDSIEVLYSDEYKKECTSTGMMTSKELDKLSLMSHKIGKNEIEEYANKWESLIKDGSKLYIFENNELIGVPYDYIYEQIIDFIKKEKEVIVVEIVFKFSKKYNISVEYLIRQLIEDKKIKVLESNEIFSKIIVGLS